MVPPSIGKIVIVQFPFSDLTDVKYRPAVIVADALRNDWLLCQITSKAYSDPRAVELTDFDFDTGSLAATSYVRPAKIFCANQRIMGACPGVLRPDAIRRVIEAVINVLTSGLP